MRVLAAVLAIATLCLMANTAGAEVFLEPEAGFKALTGDAGNILNTGPTFGGDLGILLSPEMAIVGHLDVGIHDAASESNLVVEDGASLNLLMGARFFPGRGQGKQPSVSPHMTAYVGRSSIAWNYTPDAQYILGEDNDAVGAWTFGGDVGLGIPVSEGVVITGMARFLAHAWDNETTKNFGIDMAGQEIMGMGSIRFHF